MKPAAIVLGVALVLFLAGLLFPSGLPAGVVLLGVVLGSLQALTAMGIVLIYRASRAISFAQAEIGGLAAAVAVVMVTGMHLPYFAALPIGLIAAIATGALVDVIAIRRLFRAPRLIVTVATIGVAQIVGAAEIGLPTMFKHLRPFSTFKTPFTAHVRVGPVLFTGDHLVALVVVPIVLGGLWLFLNRTDAGIAVRAAADNDERAQLLGIPVRRLSTMTWMIAAGLSGLGAILATPITGVNVGVIAGPGILLPPLAAAVIARLESLPVAFFAAIGISVAQQAVFWSYPQSASIDVLLFVLVVGALVLQRRTAVRDAGDLGGYVAVEEVRPIPREIAALAWVRAGKVGLGVAVAGAVALGLLAPPNRLTLLADVAIYGIIAVSLVVLTGWAGQISLGQFAFVGIGAATTGSLLVHLHADLFVALVASMLVTGTAAVLLGLPALRISGLSLAVVTLAFAVPVSSWVLDPSSFGWLNPTSVARPSLFDGRIDLNAPRTFYLFCIGLLALSILVARNWRRSRIGRVTVAVRDNPRAAAAYSISPTRARLSAFGLSGALAGLAGGIYVVGLRGVAFGGFDAQHSVVAFTMVVVGGLASLPGALLGAAYVKGSEFFLHGAIQLLATGAGLLVLLLVLPGGLGQLMYRIRDLLLPRMSRTSTPEVPPPSPSETADGLLDGLLKVSGLDVSYGQVQVLSAVDLAVRDREILALLGTNGAGKSTLLRAIAGTVTCGGGTVSFDGTTLGSQSAPHRVRDGIALVPGGRGVFPSLTVDENLRLGSWTTRRDPAWVAEAQARVLALFPILGTRRSVRAVKLSGGEQQMLTIAQALLGRPRVLMIDELSLGLAPTVVAELLQVVRDLRDAGTTIVLVEQSVTTAAQIADRAVFLERGTVRFDGAVEDLLGRDDLLRPVFVTRRAADRTRAARGAAFEAAEVTKGYGGVAALSAVGLTVEPGEIVGIIGSNGAGKTTLLDICSGFETADRGVLRLDGRSITKLSAADRAELGLGRVFQDARLFPSVTVEEAILIALERHVDVREPVACALRVGAAVRSERAARVRAGELIESLGLEAWRDAFVSELSTGTRRIAELACSLAHAPRLLFLDEPTAGVAQAESQALVDLLVDVRERTQSTFVIVEHDVPLLASISDHLVCLHLGSVIASGAPDDVLRDPEVVASFLGPSTPGRPRRGRASSSRGRSRALAGSGGGRTGPS